MQPTIPITLTPSDVSQMLSELNRFQDSSIGKLLCEYYRDQLTRCAENMASDVQKANYTNAHEQVGARSALKGIFCPDTGALFPGLAQHLQKQINERKSKALGK